MSIPCEMKPLGRCLLPTGFVELEFLESSGTQYIETGLEVDAAWGAKVEWEITKITNYANVLSVNNATLEGKIINAGGFVVPYWNGVAVNGEPLKFYAVFMSQGEKKYFLDRAVQVGVRYTSELNFCNSRQVKLNSESLGVIPETIQNFPCKNPLLFGASRNGAPLGTARLTGKVFRAQISKGAALKMYLVPVLNADGVPGMFDKVSKQFFKNAGRGTFGYRIKRTGETHAPFSLRDPWRVAPSGVYARVADEKELEVHADTEETTGEGWEWFANVAEAYEHFGIEPLEEDFLTE